MPYGFFTIVIQYHSHEFLHLAGSDGVFASPFKDFTYVFYWYLGEPSAPITSYCSGIFRSPTLRNFESPGKSLGK